METIDTHVKCPSCGRVVPKGTYCIYCGSPLDKATPVEIVKEARGEVEEKSFNEIVINRLEKLEKLLEGVKVCPKCGTLVKGSKCSVCGTELE